jgi:hypothetical protein
VSAFASSSEASRPSSKQNRLEPAAPWPSIEGDDGPSSSRYLQRVFSQMDLEGTKNRNQKQQWNKYENACGQQQLGLKPVGGSLSDNVVL